MVTVYTYKKQGNGSDSWHVDTHDCETKEQATKDNRVTREIVFEDPENPPRVSMSLVDLKTATNEQIEDLKALLGL